MHYPSLTRKFLLATIMSTSAALPSYASTSTEDLIENKGAITQEPATQINVSNPEIADQDKTPSAESVGLFGWIFGQKTATPTALTVQTDKDEVQENIQVQTTPSAEVLLAPTVETPVAATSGWSLNPLTLFGLIGSGTTATPQSSPEETITQESNSLQNAINTDTNADDEESAIEGEIWQPEPEPEQQASSSQQHSASPFGAVSHELYGFDPSQSTMFDLQAALAQVKENKRSFTHSYSIESRLRSVTLPSGDLFSVYPEAKYTLALGDIKIDFSGKALDAAINQGKSLTGLALFSVQTDANETALFKIKNADNVSFISADHLFFEPLRSGAELQDTHNPFGLFFADEKSFTLGQDDLVTFKIFGENFKTTAESLRRVGSPFVENFLQTYQRENALRVNRISRDGKFVYKRTQ